MKHLIETTDLNSLPIAEYGRLILDSTTNEIVYRGGVTYEVIPDEYIYNEIDNKYYQKLVAYDEPIKINSTVDLNNEWVSDSEDSNYKYFKSNSNVGKDDSYSQCKVTWSNLTSITFKYMSSSEMCCDYLCVGKLDGEKFTSQPSDGESNVYLSTMDKTSGEYYEFTINCDEGEHHIWFCYQKDSSDNEGEDRGFIGVPKSVVPILDVKQGSELPTEYNKYGGISAEGGKIYDINCNNVTVPNGSIVTDYKNVEKIEKSINAEYVDLGLPSGLKWAKCNIGASSETESGAYFQWGDISGVSGSLVGKYSDESYSWATAPFNNGSSDYNPTYFNSVKNTVCPNGVLAKEYDTASQIMGGDWRMPTKADFDELLSGTTHEWVTNHNGTGVKGRKFTSKTDTSKYIFIPAAGYCSYGSVYGVGSYGYVWSSSLYSSDPYGAWGLYFYSGNCGMDYSSRCIGQSVRGVRK